MRKLLFLYLLTSSAAVAQPNCLIYDAKDPCREACEKAVQAAELPQGSRSSQVLFDESIALCPTLDYAYAEKSVPYLKRGEFITWKKLMDKAVELNPDFHLGYRGWCRYQFLRDYAGAIDDLERLTTLRGWNLGYSSNGNYHLAIALALCYKAIGAPEKAIELIQTTLARKEYSVGIFDYLHLGVLKLEQQDLEGAVQAFNLQIQNNQYVAETYYYLAMAYEAQGNSDLVQQNLVRAKQYYQQGYRLFDPYTHPMDNVYLSQIDQALANAEKR